MSLNAKMTALADKIRELSGTTSEKGIEDMALDIDGANAEVVHQAALIAEILEALSGSQSLEVLEGDGQEYYTTAPSTLSFRSTAPLAELQNVTVDGEIIDPSNYELEEGSTIVKLNIDYLKTLDVGNYEIGIESLSKTAKGNFTVAAPELNKYEFYYNQPYYGYFEGADTFERILLFLNEDSCKVINPYTGDSEIVEYTIDNDMYTLIVSDYIIKGRFTSANFFECPAVEVDNPFIIGDLTSADGGFILATDLSLVKCDDYYVYYMISLGEETYYNVALINRDETIIKPCKTNINNIPVSRVTHLGFSNYQGTSINLPDSIFEIEAQGFAQSSNLTSIELSKNLAYIGDRAFLGCTKLTNITFRDTVNQWEAIFKGTDWNDTVPATCVHCVDGDIALS